ncbi:MAG: lipopolysaccharide heptosyltransferase II [Candidatus Adiutrix sp.]|nr:lipopolysaccharide heptosyltransferase II [Candidatus Adiutrix sp.]
MPKIKDSKPAHILVRGTNWVGDAVMTLPALRALAEACPDSRLTVLTRSWAADIYRGQPGVEAILADDHRGVLGRSGLLGLARKLKALHFDLAVLFQNAFGAALTSALARIPQRWGYARDGRSFLLTRAVELQPADRLAHESFYYLELLERLGFPAPFSQPRLILSPEAVREADKIWREAGPGDWSAPLLLAPGAAFGSAKRWPVRNFAAAAEIILKTQPSGTVILGSRGEIPVAGELAKLLPGPVLNLAGRTSLAISMAVMARGKLLLTNDSGLMHLGGALNVPLVAVFGPTNPRATAPLGRSRIIRSRAACAPCLKRECPLERQVCFDQVTPELAARAALDILAPPAGRRGSPAVFLDRDGTINRDVSFLAHPDQFELLPGAARGIAALVRHGFKAVVVTNQSGLARGLFTREDLRQIHARMTSLLAQEGARLAGLYLCPHHPEGTVLSLARECDCRKPESALYEQAARELSIDLSRSIWVGDRQRDLQAAAKFGGRSILVLTGYGLEEARGSLEFQPTLVAPDLRRAAEWIVS